MLVSTFELLVKSQLPGPKQVEPPIDVPPPEVLDKLKKISRTVIQGYFLTISNLNSFDVTISLIFTALTPSISIKETITLLDVTGENVQGDLSNPNLLDGKARYTLTVKANDTGLFILQPDFFARPQLLNDRNFEVRGYVEVFISSLSKGEQSARLLLTPEHRGTFFKNLDKEDPQLDQIVYPLPTARGGSLFQLNYSA